MEATWHTGYVYGPPPDRRQFPTLRFSLKLVQAASRFIAILFELGTISFISYIYNVWRSEPGVKVEVIFPSFFPVVAATLMNAYEVISLCFLDRKWPINPVAACFDIAFIAVGIFCFLILGTVDHGIYRPAGSVVVVSGSSEWDVDVNNAMIFMIVFTIVHVYLLLMACVGYIYVSVRRSRAKKLNLVARNQAEMVHFYERRRTELFAQVASGPAPKPEPPRADDPPEPS
ncbi:hypothetical protein B0T24DRAFT_672697 [Lasiosphaeria ovina]|uniref:Uncharacterized protein n=1 Tax=Lasiosphaeria ovina TaxID=92902 RepID=A0AAE0NJR4_9PEZI|nr:hypothetical protein B0T24DRAFT_672697 [Lasiosphaeria ovina]